MYTHDTSPSTRLGISLRPHATRRPPQKTHFPHAPEVLHTQHCCFRDKENPGPAEPAHSIVSLILPLFCACAWDPSAAYPPRSCSLPRAAAVVEGSHVVAARIPCCRYWQFAIVADAAERLP